MSDTIEDQFLPISIEQKESLYSGFRSYDLYSYRETGSGLRARRELVEGGESVAIVAHDRERDLLVMIRQFRLGAQLGTGRGMTIEIPAGMVDKGENPEATARRELQEETGLTASRLVKLCRFLTTPGLTNEVLHLYYAEVDSSKLLAEAGLETESEQTFPFALTPDEALTAIDQNRLNNGIVMVGLLWFARHRDTITKEQTP